MNDFKTEEEQVEDIKRWWKENGRAVIAGLVIGISAIVGVRYWGEYKISQGQQGSERYVQMQKSVTANKNAEALQQGEKILKDFASTPYASMASLMMAKLAVESNELDKAVIHLQWVMDKGLDKEFKHIARQRLARVLLSQEKYDAALALLSGVELGGYVSIYEEIRGDVLLAQGLSNQAREKYRMALDAESGNSQRRQLLEMKLNDLSAVVKKEVS